MFQGNNFYCYFLQNEFFFFKEKTLVYLLLKRTQWFSNISQDFVFVAFYSYVVTFPFCPIDHMASSPAVFLLFLINIATQQSDIFWRLLPVKVERFQVIGKADAMSYIFIVELTSERIYSNRLSSLCSTSKSSGFINH